MENRELSREQLDERVAILRRFRALLEQQRRKFREYLTVLEKQEQMIDAENVDAVVRHTELEQSIISEIYTIQKVINPLEEMYRESNPGHPDAEIPKLQTDLEHLRKQVLDQNEKNRNLLKSHMQALRQKVVSLQNPYTKRSSVYAGNADAATRIDIEQ